MAQHVHQAIINGVVPGTKVGLVKMWAGVPGRIIEFHAGSDIANANNAAIFDINVHDPTTEVATSLFAADQSQRPSLGAGQRRVSKTGLSQAVARLQKMSIDVDQMPAGGLGPLSFMLVVEDDMGLVARSNVVLVTSSIASGASLDVDLALGKGSFIYAIQTSVSARVRLYHTAARRTADVDRPVGQLPTGSPNEHGLITEVNTTSGNLKVDLAPVAFANNMENSVVGTIPTRITNTGATGPVTITVTRLPLEI